MSRASERQENSSSLSITKKQLTIMIVINPRSIIYGSLMPRKLFQDV